MKFCISCFENTSHKGFLILNHFTEAVLPFVLFLSLSTNFKCHFVRSSFFSGVYLSMSYFGWYMFARLFSLNEINTNIPMKFHGFFLFGCFLLSYLYYLLSCLFTVFIEWFFFFYFNAKTENVGYILASMFYCMCRMKCFLLIFSFWQPISTFYPRMEE